MDSQNLGKERHCSVGLSDVDISLYAVAQRLVVYVCRHGVEPFPETNSLAEKHEPHVNVRRRYPLRWNGYVNGKLNREYQVSSDVYHSQYKDAYGEKY